MGFRQNADIMSGKSAYTDAQLSMLKVGQIAIETMIWDGDSDHIAYSGKITVRSLKHGNVDGWGAKIFEGTLEELIAKLAPLPAEEPKTETPAVS